MIRYTVSITDRTIAELEVLDRKTRKLMTAHRTLHPQSDIDRLYLPRRSGGRGLLQIRQTVEEEIRNLSEYISSSTKSALKEVITEGLLTVEDTKKEYKRKKMKNLQEKGRTRRCMANTSTTQRGNHLELAEEWLSKERNGRIHHGCTRSGNQNQCH